MIALSPTISWTSQRNEWTAHYVRILKKRLIWAAGYVQRHHHTAHDLRAHLDSLLTLVRQGWRWKATQPHAVRLTVALLPWPERWGEWTMWENVLRGSIEIARRIGDAASQARLLTSLGWTLFYTGRLDAARETGQKALALAVREGLAQTVARSGGVVVSVYVSQADYETARTTWHYTAEKLAAIRAAVQPEVYTYASLRLQLYAVNILRRQNRWRDALTRSRAAVRQLESLPNADPHLLASARMTQGVMLWVLNDYPEAAESTRRAIAGFLQAGDTASAATLYGNLGLIHWSMGWLHLAETQLQTCVTQMEQMNIQWELLRCIGDLGLTYLSQGRIEKALLYTTRHIELATRIQEQPEVTRGHGNRGVVWYHLGEYTRAQQDLETDLDYSVPRRRWPAVVMSYANLSRCHAALGQWEQMHATAIAAQESAHRSRSPELMMLAWRVRAECASPHHRAALLERALSLAVHLHRHLDQAACLLALAALSPQRESSQQLWQRGVHLLYNCGAQRWLKGQNIYHPPQMPLTV